VPDGFATSDGAACVILGSARSARQGLAFIFLSRHCVHCVPFQRWPRNALSAAEEQRVVAVSEAALTVARRTVSVRNAILHIEAAPNAADRQANPPQPALAKAELRRHELRAHLSLVRHRAIVCAWTAERSFRAKSWHVHHRSPLPKWRVRTGYPGVDCLEPEERLIVHSTRPWEIEPGLCRCHRGREEAK